MLAAAVQVAVAPALVGAATLASGRWGPRVGGVVSAFPAIVGPVLLLGAEAHGATFAARAAAGTLLGLVALSGFAVAYGRAALRARWPASLAAGWLAAGAIAAALGGVEAGPVLATVAAALSLAAAHAALARGGERPVAAVAAGPDAAWELPLRMALTALLVVALVAAGNRLGPTAGGVLAALPVLASVLAVRTHAGQGPQAARTLLRGVLGGMAGFVAFCALVAALTPAAGVPIAFAAATLAAVGAQVGAARAGRPPWRGGRLRAVTG